jgi:hypothetical protein
MLLITLRSGEWDAEDRTLRFARNVLHTPRPSEHVAGGMECPPRRNVAVVSFSVLALMKVRWRTDLCSLAYSICGISS